jgi:hypothetical protein
MARQADREAHLQYCWRVQSPRFIDLGHRSNLAGSRRCHRSRLAGVEGRCSWPGSRRAKNHCPQGKTVPAPGSGGVGSPAAAKELLDAAGEAENVSGTASWAGGGGMAGQRKVISLRRPGGPPWCGGAAGAAAGSRQGLQRLVETLSVLLPVWSRK